MALTEATIVHVTAVPPSGARTPVKRRWEIWMLVVLSSVVYIAVAVWLRYILQYIIGDSLARTADAAYVLFSRDPHLAAIGAVWLPLPPLIQIPFALLLRPFGQLELAGPASTAFCTIVTTVIIARICQLLDLSRVATFAIALAWAANPVTVFYAANGMSEATFFVFAALMMLGYLGWIRLNRTSYLVIMAAGLAGAVLVRYEAVALVPVMAVLAAWDKSRFRLSILTIVIVALPATVAFILWLVSDWILLGDPLYWLKGLSSVGIPPDNAAWLPNRHDVLANLVYVGRWTLIFGPLLAVLVLLLVHPRRARGTLGILAAAGVFPFGHFLLLLQHKSFGDPRYFATAVLFATVGAAWLASAAPRRWWLRAPWQTAVVAVLLVGAVTAPVALSDHVATSVESEWRVFGSFIGTPSQIATNKHDPQSTQEFSMWRQVAADLDPELARGKRVLVDTNLGFAVVLFSRHPSGFIVSSDRDFESILADPAGSVDYAISSYTCNGAGPDEVSQRFGYPSGGDPGPGLVHDYGCARLYRLQPPKT
jgi:Dolichyl-phosphate-mannose-protein mannosyltransferase